VEREILEINEMSEIVFLLKTFKTIKIGEKLGFFRSLMSKVKILNWQTIISDSIKENITSELVRTLITEYNNRHNLLLH